MKDDDSCYSRPETTEHGKFICPRGLGAVDCSCLRSEDAFFICFVTPSWGNPLGVGISSIFSLVAFGAYWKSGTEGEA